MEEHVEMSNQKNFSAGPTSIFKMDSILSVGRCYSNHYNTTGRNGLTIGGDSVYDEMCISYSVFYPNVEMNGCSSYPKFDQLSSFVMEDVP